MLQCCKLTTTSASIFSMGLEYSLPEPCCSKEAHKHTVKQTNKQKYRYSNKFYLIARHHLPTSKNSMLRV
jgi:hypothetical protein